MAASYLVICHLILLNISLTLKILGKSSLDGIRNYWSEEDSETDGADSIEETVQNSFFKR